MQCDSEKEDQRISETDADKTRRVKREQVHLFQFVRDERIVAIQLIELVFERARIVAQK